MDVEKEAAALDKKAADHLRSLYSDLSAWRKCQVARHPQRPHCRDYIDRRCSPSSRRWPATATLPTTMR